jgi:hypothetical protein
VPVLSRVEHGERGDLNRKNLLLTTNVNERSIPSVH